MKNFRYIILILVTALSIQGMAQAPNWSVDFRAYQYNMSVTAVITNDCVELGDSNNMIAAFVNDTIRGVANTVEDSGRYYALFLVYSNLSFGDTVSFRYYNATTDSIYYSLYATIFQDNASIGDFVNPFPIINNLPPDSVYLSNDSIVENELNMPIGSFFSAEYTFVPQTHTYTLVSGPGDIDNANFSIQGDTLYLDSAFDYETQSTASIRVMSADNDGCAKEEVFQFVIHNVNEAPTDLLLSANTIDENTIGNRYIGQLSAIDQDSSESFTYSLVSGAPTAVFDNASFSISGDSLVATTGFNFELKDSLLVLAETFDLLGNRFEKSLRILVNDLNDIQDSLTLDSNSVFENLAVGALVGTFTSHDEDVSQTHQYTFNNITGNNNALFNINGNQLFTNSTFNFEQQNQYLVYVQSNDQNGGLVTAAFDIYIADTNDTPTDIFLSNASVNEGLAVGTFVGILSSIDEDVTDTFSYSFTTGSGSADNANFLIRTDSLFTSVVLDSTIQSQHSIRIKTADALGAEYSESFNIFVKKVNKMPTAINLSTDTINENATINSIAAFLSTDDLDPGDVHAYSLVSGAGDGDNSSFTLFNNQLLVDTTFDFNQKRLYQIRLQSDDGFGGLFEDSFVLNIKNSNDAPDDLFLSDTSIVENMPSGSLVAVLSSSDRDSSDTHTYELAFGNNDNQLFRLSGDSLYTNTSFNYEARSQFLIDLRTIDAGGLFYTKRYEIDILDTNDAPSGIQISNDSLLENTLIGTTISNMISLDEDVSDSFTYTLVNGIGDIDNALFRVANEDLLLVSPLNFELKNKLSIRLRSTDSNGASIERIFSLTIIDESEAPSDIILSSNNFDENLDSASIIMNLNTIDDDNNEQFTYELVNGSGSANNGLFRISGNNLLTNVTFDFEDKDKFKIRIKTTDKDSLTFEKEFELLVNDKNDKPVGVNQQFTLSESESVGNIIGTLNFIDEDAGDVLTFELLENEDLFGVESTTGELMVLNNLNFESDKTLMLVAQTTDAAGETARSEITIYIENAIDDKLPVAKIFSPNGDGMNDTWRIANVESYSNYKLIIFSVSGEVVYEIAADYNNEWEGIYNGNNLPEGVYYYIFQNNSNSSKVFKGSITLKR